MKKMFFELADDSKTIVTFTQESWTDKDNRIHPGGQRKVALDLDKLLNGDKVQADYVNEITITLSDGETHKVYRTFEEVETTEKK